VRSSIVTLRSDPAAALVVSFGRDGGALFVDPYRGTVLGGFSRVHDFLHEVVEWHRWLGAREVGRPITGAANLGFLGLVSLGVFLWWPRRWTAAGLRQVTRFDLSLRGRARNFPLGAVRRPEARTAPAELGATASHRRGRRGGGPGGRADSFGRWGGPGVDRPLACLAPVPSPAPAGEPGAPSGQPTAQPRSVSRLTLVATPR